MRLVYLGTPASAVPPLVALADRHEIALVVSQPDRRRGRRGAPEAAAVKAAALERGLEVATPSRARDVVEAVRSSGAQLGVVVAFGQLLPEELLRALPDGFVNVHFSLLPRWRGAAPVERALLAGDSETGVCIMRLDTGLDTGPIYARRTVPIGARETAGELTERLVGVGTELLVATLPQVPTLTPEPQGGAPLLAPKLTVEEFALDWHQPARVLDRVVRAGNPRPGAWTILDGARLKVWLAEPVDAVATAPGHVEEGGVVGAGEDGLRLLEVQPAGRRAMSATAWLAGRRGRPTVLGS